MTALLFKGTPPPFWEMTVKCMGFDGKLIHFPRGTYVEQVATESGRIELNMMDRLWSVGQVVLRKTKGWKDVSEEAMNKDVEFLLALGFTYEQILG